ncbi:MAG: hypothetical protein ACREN3_12630 [Gemmatimonadaceae bacterium]
MTWREWTSGLYMRAALGALVVSTGAVVWASVVALRTHAVEAAPSAVVFTPGALDTRAAALPVDVRAAVATDLFATNREAPPVPYRAPGDVPVAGPVAPRAAPQPVVLGTALAADGSSFATCQFASSRLLMVRVGDHVGNYLVKSIERRSVVFSTPDGKRLEIFALLPGS